MTVRTTKILFPAITSLKSDTIYLRGYVSVSKFEIIVFLVDYSTEEELVWNNSESSKNVIYGICNGGLTKSKKHIFSNYVIFNYDRIPQIHKLFLNGCQIDCTENCILMLYEYDKIKDSGIIWDSGGCIRELQILIQRYINSVKYYEKPYEPLFESPLWLSYTMFGQHISNCVNLFYWLYTSIRRDRKVSIKQGNLILAVIMDIMMGYFVLKFLTLNEKELGEMLTGVLEKLVNFLYSLLKWLMGAPAGLKLNNAFNKMLGKYFSYHTQLWWLFLDVTGEKLDVILRLFHCIGYAGFSFQAAIISDMFCVATFHSYCIYVYAARLFNIQVSGLIALLRLFVGRKHNPLRGGIDSCEYTNQELFVGTVAFTILLLLMPTTAMYYAVFTLFRLLSLVVQHSLAKLIYWIQIQPSYVIALWLTKSSKVAGNILVEVISNEDSAPVILKLNLLSKPLYTLVNNFKPPVVAPRHLELTNLVSNVLSGKQII